MVMEKALWMHSHDFQWGSLHGVLSGNTSRTLEVAAGKEQSRIGNSDVFRRERVIPGVRFIPCVFYVSPGIRDFPLARKS